MPLPSPNAYDFDPTGQDPDNLIENEIHILAAENSRDYHYHVPDFSPFYADSMVVQYKAPNAAGFTDLVPGVDYHFSYPYIGAQLRTGKQVYGGVSFLNIDLAGEIRYRKYQTVGGEFTLDQTKLTEILANIVYNPRITTWEQVSGAPAHFPPHAHAWAPEDMVGLGAVLASLNSIRDAILQNTDQSLLSHIRDKGNPHRVRKDQIGLDKIMNWPPSTIAQAIAGVDTQSYMTPATTKAMVSQIDARQYLTLQEALAKKSNSKILTFDVFLQFMRTFGIMTDIDPITVVPTAPTILYPLDQGAYLSDQFMRCLPYTGFAAGTVYKTQVLTGVSTMTIPAGVNSIKFTGSGAVGTTQSTGGAMVAKTPLVTPSDFESRANLSGIVQTITGEQGQMSVKVVSSVDGIDETMNLPLINASSNQRVYSTSFPIGVSSGEIKYASITLIYEGTPPIISNSPGSDANVVLMGKTFTFPGSPNSATIAQAKSFEIILNVAQATQVNYTCPSGTTVTASWYEPATSNAKVQTDTEWQISIDNTFASSSIVDSTTTAKGNDFTLTQWKPTRNAMTANTIYYVRSRWAFNDNTKSDWSGISLFTYYPANPYAPEGTITGYFCKGTTRYANVSDGLGGYREVVNEINSLVCGYDSGTGAAPITTTVTAIPKITIARSDLNYLQGGESHPFQTTVQIPVVLDNFIENIEDDRIRLYLTDSFYSDYLTFKNKNGTENARNFRIPVKVLKDGMNTNISISLVPSMSPSGLGRTGYEPYTFFVKVGFTPTGYATTFEEWINKTTIDFMIDPIIFKDGTGAAFVAQSLVGSSSKKLFATTKASVLISYTAA
jgi:hypothetical protein